jgi:hypothetical protein
LTTRTHKVTPPPSGFSFESLEDGTWPSQRTGEFSFVPKYRQTAYPKSDFLPLPGPLPPTIPHVCACAVDQFDLVTKLEQCADLFAITLFPAKRILGSQKYGGVRKMLGGAPSFCGGLRD